MFLPREGSHERVRQKNDGRAPVVPEHDQLSELNDGSLRAVNALRSACRVICEELNAQAVLPQRASLNLSRGHDTAAGVPVECILATAVDVEQRSDRTGAAMRSRHDGNKNGVPAGVLN